MVARLNLNLPLPQLVNLGCKRKQSIWQHCIYRVRLGLGLPDYNFAVSEQQTVNKSDAVNKNLSVLAVRCSRRHFLPLHLAPVSVCNQISSSVPVVHTQAHTAHRSSSVRLWGILLFLGLWFQDCTSILLPHPSTLPRLSSLSVYAISSTLLFPSCLLSHLCPSPTISSPYSVLFPLSSLSSLHPCPCLVRIGLKPSFIIYHSRGETQGLTDNRRSSGIGTTIEGRPHTHRLMYSDRATHRHTHCLLP